MRKRLKGFTLLECIVALAVLGVASLTMAQIYAGVSRGNTNNHLVNTSLSYQMQYVEKKINAQALPEYYNNSAAPIAKSVTSPPTGAGGMHLEITKVKEVKNDGTKVLDNNCRYTYPVDVYILYSRDKENRGSQEASYNPNGLNDKKHINLRYKYFVPHEHLTK